MLKLITTKLNVEESSYENLLLLILALLGIFRMLIALILDFARNPLSIVEIVTDSFLLSIFTWLLVAAKNRKSQKEISPFFGIIASVLILVNYLEFGGAMGNARFNFYAGIFLLVMLYSANRMKYLLVFYFCLMMLINYGFVTQNDFMTQFRIEAAHNLANFTFTLICIAFLTVLLKYVTETQIDQYESLNRQLRSKIKESKKASRKLAKQHKELAHAQELLEQQIKLKTEALESKNQAVENYVKYNTQHLNTHLDNLDSLAGGIKGNETMSILLRASCAELKAVIENITKTLDSEQHLDRTTL
jgi:hypothetical protein